MRNTTLILFFIHLLTRVVFVFLTGFFNNYALQLDSLWLVTFGLENAAHFNFNFELDRFVASPLYPTLIGLFKIVFNQQWALMLILFQLMLSSLSGVYIYKIGSLLFNKKTGVLASLIYSVFPLTLWYTHTFSQECLFQTLHIISMFFLIKSIKKQSISAVILSGIFFSLAYLTKSHILLFSIFIPLIYFHFFGFKKQTFLYSAVFAAVALTFSIPYGLYGYKIHHQYIISSNGSGYQFYLGNTEVGYKTVVDVPKKGTDDFRRIRNVNKTAGYFNGSMAHYDSILRLPQKEKQRMFFHEGLAWIKANPIKFIKLKAIDALLFLTPGISYSHYSLTHWLLAFLLSLPIYLLAYYTMLKMYISGNPSFVFILYLFLSMLIFSMVWYVQNRFRTITIEPFYIIYAAYALTGFHNKNLQSANRLLGLMVDET